MEEYLEVLSSIESVNYGKLRGEVLFWFGYYLGKGNLDHFENLSLFQKIKNYSKKTDKCIIKFMIYQALFKTNECSSALNAMDSTGSTEMYLYSQSDINIAEYQRLYNFVNSIPEEIKEENEIISEYFYDDQPDFLPAKEMTTCKICLEELEFDPYTLLSNCTCNFHTACFNKYLITDIENRKFPIKCPDCKLDISENDIMDRLDVEFQEKYTQYFFKEYVERNPGEYSWCPTPNCPYVFVANDQNHFSCQICKKEYCLNCKVDFHRAQTCTQYQQTIKLNKEQSSDQNFLQFVRGSNFKQCPNCKYWVEKSSGCNHMTCRCSFQFCYVCGGKYGACLCRKF